jgi:hypothetical protein
MMSEVTRFCNLHNVVDDFRKFAAQYQTLAEVWDHCQQPEVMLWLLDKSQQRDHDKLREFTSWLLNLPDYQPDEANIMNPSAQGLTLSEDAAHDAPGEKAWSEAWTKAWFTSGSMGSTTNETLEAQAAKLREIIGNPFVFKPLTQLPALQLHSAQYRMIVAIILHYLIPLCQPEASPLKKPQRTSLAKPKDFPNHFGRAGQNRSTPPWFQAGRRGLAA